MDPLVTNPFAVLTFIAAPAILTNASSVMALGTSNRFARTVDRSRALSAEIEKGYGSPGPFTALRLRQLQTANRRVLMLVRALTCFYLSLGGFAAASFTSLLGAVFVISGHATPRMVAMGIAFGCGVIGVSGLVAGSGILVWESRLAFAVLLEETRLIVEELNSDGLQRTGDERQP